MHSLSSVAIREVSLLGFSWCWQIEFGAHQVIIVRDREAKRTLPNELKGAIALTVFEAKGLEFDDVFIIDFFKDSPASVDEWRAMGWYMDLWQAKNGRGDTDFATELLQGAPRPLRPGEFENHRSAYGRILEELKQLYTAFTRARVSLFMYDSDEEKRLPMFHLLLTQQLVKRVSMSSVQEELEGEDLDLNASNGARCSELVQNRAHRQNGRKQDLDLLSEVCLMQQSSVLKRVEMAIFFTVLVGKISLPMCFLTP